VDIVLEDGRLVGVEVKAAATVGVRDFTGSRAVAGVSGDRCRPGIVLHTRCTVVLFGKNLNVLPIRSLWPTI
jgi:hypothetical protein